MKTVGKIIAYALIALLLVGAVYIVFKYTNNGTTDFKTFYVEANGTTYLDKGQISLPLNEEIRFETKYTFASNKAENHKGYTVKILPNKSDGISFDYTADGQNYSFSNLKDCSTAFNLVKDGTGFTIKNDGLSIGRILQSMYEGKTVEFDETALDMSNAYFNLVISSYNGESTVTIGLLFDIHVFGVSLDKGEIVF